MVIHRRRRFGRAGISGGSSAFDWTTLTPHLRYRMQGLGLAEDAVINPYVDISGNGRNATVVSGGPLYKGAVVGGRAIARSDGNDRLDTASFAIAQPCTYFIVANTSQSGNQILFNGQGNRHQIWLTGGAIAMFAGAGVLVDDVATGAGFKLITGIFNGAASKARLNGVDTLTGDLGAGGLSGGIMFGSDGSNLYTGDLAEFIVVPGAIAGATLTAAELSLLTYYGL